MNKCLSHIFSDGIDFRHSADDCPDQNEFPPHIHNFYELFVFVEGDAGYTVENKLYSLRSYDMLIIRPGQFHYLNLRSARPYRRMVIHFSEDNVMPVVVPLIQKGGYFRLGRDSEIVSLLYKLCDYGTAREKCDAKALLPNILSEILIDTKYLSPDRSEAGVLGSAAAIADYINSHICEPMTVDSIAKDLYLSRSYVSHVFSRDYHMGVMQFVRRKKVIAAEKLIKNGTRASEAAYACGFADYATFYRSYCQILGRAPSSDKV